MIRQEVTFLSRANAKENRDRAPPLPVAGAVTRLTVDCAIAHNIHSEVSSSGRAVQHKKSFTS